MSTYDKMVLVAFVTVLSWGMLVESPTEAAIVSQDSAACEMVQTEDGWELISCWSVGCNQLEQQDCRWAESIDENGEIHTYQCTSDLEIDQPIQA